MPTDPSPPSSSLNVPPSKGAAAIRPWRGGVAVAEIAAASALIFFLGHWGGFLVLLAAIGLLAFTAQGKWLGKTQGVVLALLLIVLFFTVAEFVQAGVKGRLPDSLSGIWSDYYSGFFNAETLQRIAADSSMVAVAALGMTVIIIAGGIDLSAGTALALAATVAARCVEAQTSPAIAVLAGIGVGGLAGLFNGVLVSALGVVPFIVTLGTMTIFLGLGEIISKETSVRPAMEIIPLWLREFVKPIPEHKWLIENLLPNFALGVWLSLVLAVITAAILKFTVFGRHVVAIGSNEAAARLCGIRVPRLKTAVYTFAGLYFGMAGLYQFSLLSSATPTEGRGMELPIIAAVVMGGGSLSGGSGSIAGTLLGAALMTVISYGCITLGIGNPVYLILLGTIIIAAVFVDQLRQRRMQSA